MGLSQSLNKCFPTKKILTERPDVVAWMSSLAANFKAPQDDLT